MFICNMILIVSGGDPPGDEILKASAQNSEMIIAADKGAQYCLDAGIIPDIITGDMDSVPKETLDILSEKGAKIISYSSDKDETDTGLALDVAIERGAEQVEILSGIGDRFDHSIANVHLLYKALIHGINAYILTSRHKIFLVDSKYCIEEMKGSTISFLPLTERAGGICLDGFAYNIKDAVMEMGFPYGVSNVITSDKATVRVSEGVIIGIISR
ncbi:MAG: thiamine diphosphokinase [Thermodesulfobacteriota bacterium]|nr:thiamine diphosphokinase [Thermodesulfobacteriota bacterium]